MNHNRQEYANLLEDVESQVGILQTISNELVRQVLNIFFSVVLLLGFCVCILLPPCFPSLNCLCIFTIIQLHCTLVEE